MGGEYNEHSERRKIESRLFHIVGLGISQEAPCKTERQRERERETEREREVVLKLQYSCSEVIAFVLYEEQCFAKHVAHDVLNI